MRKPLYRIAFLTSEFVSETQKGGGLGNYLHRITQALKDMGHVPEVFVVRQSHPRVIDFHGVRVERVPTSRRLPHRLLHRLIRSTGITRGAPLLGPEGYLLYAQSLADAFRKRHAEARFDFLQSTNCWSSGLFVPRMKDCPHLVRLSSMMDLWSGTDGETGFGMHAMNQLERRCVRRADIAYSPSRFLADRCRNDGWRDDVRVLRPPAFLEVDPAPTPPEDLPPRFLVHYGQMGRRKGSFWLARALREAWEQQPDLRMVWVGKTIQRGDFERCHEQWGAFARNVTWLGAIPKPELYAVVQRAQASVLPSLADNLPNTVIESLMLGIPVIGTQGASIDELVKPPYSGELIPVEDLNALTDALVRAWRGQAAWSATGFRPPRILDELDPVRAAEGLLRLAEEAREKVRA